jgi:HSP20 family protein
MFNLIPWKKRNNGGTIAVRHAEPSCQDFGHATLARFREEFDTLFDRFFGDRSLGARGLGSLPSVWDMPQFDWNWGLGLQDEGDKYVLEAELPGFEPDDFEVRKSGNRLVIRAEHKHEEREKHGESSFRYGSFNRSFTLPAGVNEDQIEASYHSGVLKIHLPKTEQGRSKRIPVISK